MKLLRFFLPALFLNITLFTSCAKKDTPIEPAKVLALESMSFRVSKNAILKQDIQGEIIGDTVYVSTFAGTAIHALIPEFVFSGSKVTVQSNQQMSGVTANDFTQPVEYTLTAADNSQKKYVVKVTDTGIPALYISTNNIPIDSKDIYRNGTITLVGNIAGKVLFDGTMAIKGRGNSTWNMPKKPYRIKLDKKASLLGMPDNKNWVLLANYADKSLMRNALAFELSQRIGLTFTPHLQYVEVILNGEYIGNYALTEQVKEGKKQVDIEEQPDGTTELPAIAGGYLVEVDGFAETEPVYFRTSLHMPLVVKYPDNDVITPQQKEYIRGHFQQFEDALFANNFADPVLGYRKYFDVDSYVDYYLVNEVMGNSDAFWSTYMYKKRDDDRIYSGPVWDFDIAANNDSRLGDAVNQLMFNSAHQPKIWINRLMEDASFRQKVRSRWNEIKATQVQTLPPMVDQLAKKLAVSQKKNFLKWNILSKKVYLEYYIGGSYNSEVSYLKNYLTNRINWLDTKFNSANYQ
jgi:spore coat protein CotH